MRASKSNDSLLHLVDRRLFGCAALVVVLLSSVTFLSVGFGDEYFSRRLCFESGCWEEFVNLFSLPIALLVNGIKLLVAYSAIAGILVAVNTYVETRRMAVSQVHFSDAAAFKSFVNSAISKKHYLTPDKVSIETWYAMMYPGSRGGDLSLSSDYQNLLEELRAFSDKTDALILKAGRGYRHDRYHGAVIGKLRRLGFDLSSYSRLDFFSLERESYELINDVNAAFCPEQECTRLKPSMAHGIP